MSRVVIPGMGVEPEEEEQPKKIVLPPYRRFAVLLRVPDSVPGIGEEGSSNTVEEIVICHYFEPLQFGGMQFVDYCLHPSGERAYEQVRRTFAPGRWIDVRELDIEKVDSKASVAAGTKREDITVQ